MELEVLGRLRLRRDGRDVTPSGGLQRTLLGVLLARANGPVSAGELTAALWGDPPGDRADARLHVHVHRLRRLLAPDRLTAEPGGGYRAGGVPYDAARAHAGIGDTLDDLGATADARAHWRRAVAIFDALGSAESGRVRARRAPAR